MRLDASVFDVWAFQRRRGRALFLLLHTSQQKADRWFNGGRFWQIPSDFVRGEEPVTDAIARLLGRYGLPAQSIWQAEHAYLIFNRRFGTMQAIGVYAAEVRDAPVRLDPSEHAEYAWLPYRECLKRVHYRGLKDGLRSVQAYVTGTRRPAAELCLYSRP